MYVQRTARKTGRRRRWRSWVSFRKYNIVVGCGVHSYEQVWWTRASIEREREREKESAAKGCRVCVCVCVVSGTNYGISCVCVCRCRCRQTLKGNTTDGTVRVCVCMYVYGTCRRKMTGERGKREFPAATTRTYYICVVAAAVAHITCIYLYTCM